MHESWREALRLFISDELGRLNVPYTAGVTFEDDIGDVPSLAVYWDVPHPQRSGCIGRSLSVLLEPDAAYAYATAWKDDFSTNMRYLVHTAQRIRITYELDPPYLADTSENAVRSLIETLQRVEVKTKEGIPHQRYPRD